MSNHGAFLFSTFEKRENGRWESCLHYREAGLYFILYCAGHAMALSWEVKRSCFIKRQLNLQDRDDSYYTSF